MARRLAGIFICYIPKEGDTMKCESNRTIALIFHASKVLLKIMAQRMEVKLKEETAEEQADFISEKSTRNQIMNLKLIIEKYREYNKALYICFIDYRKASNSLTQQAMANHVQYGISTGDRIFGFCEAYNG